MREQNKTEHWGTRAPVKRSVLALQKPLAALTRPVVIILHSSAVSRTISAKLQVHGEFAQSTGEREGIFISTICKGGHFITLIPALIIHN